MYLHVHAELRACERNAAEERGRAGLRIITLRHPFHDNVHRIPDRLAAVDSYRRRSRDDAHERDDDAKHEQ